MTDWQAAEFLYIVISVLSICLVLFLWTQNKIKESVLETPNRRQWADRISKKANTTGKSWVNDKSAMISIALDDAEQTGEEIVDAENDEKKTSQAIDSAVDDLKKAIPKLRCLPFSFPPDIICLPPVPPKCICVGEKISGTTCALNKEMATTIGMAYKLFLSGLDGDVVASLCKVASTTICAIAGGQVRSPPRGAMACGRVVCTSPREAMLLVSELKAPPVPRHKRREQSGRKSPAIGTGPVANIRGRLPT
jgi:hypothetical protein